MNTIEQDQKVFNETAPAPVTITLHLTSLEDAAWIERAIVERKRDGYLSRLTTGILASALNAVAAVTVKRCDKVITPEQLYAVRSGRPA